MEFWESVRLNLGSPPILFFALGVLSVLMRADLRLPEPIYVGLSTYLLMAVGFKGGGALAEAGLARVWLPGLGAVIPLWCYALLRWGLKFSAVDAAAIGAHYESVSAVTLAAPARAVRAVRG
jgi:hypothetical protein